MAFFGRFFGRRSRRTGKPAPDEQGLLAASELLDRYHQRASIDDGDRMVVTPGKVLDNVAVAMERVDIDIDIPISIEEDVVSVDEMVVLIQDMRMGPTLAIHVANTAMRIMSARYPTKLVRTPLPPEYDLRKLYPLTINDQPHEIAKTIFNRRTTSTTELAEDDIAGELEPLNPAEQMEVFVALFYMFGSKVGAMKYRTGIE